MSVLPLLRAGKPATIGRALLAAAIVLVTIRADAQRASGADLKAGFLINFARFVTWPGSVLPPGGGAIVIGVTGSSPVADSLAAAVKGKTVDGRAITIKRLAAGETPALVHLLYVGEGDRERVADILARVGPNAVLTVSDTPRFCSLGGIIQLRNEDDRIRFDINLGRAEAAGLTINSKLLALAGVINPGRSH